MMNLRISVATLALALSLPAAADVVTVMEAVETTVGNINVPVSNNGRLAFKPCAGDCTADYLSVRLTPETAYAVRGKAVDFGFFRKAFYDRRRSIDGYALVSYDVKTNTVVSVRIAD